ncbi:MAG: nucleotidyltransferase domain-containing protein [Coprobacillus sp.]|nr:nucleotidyltransferase domain-containing protein [Coprobacillus sp.]
MENDLKTTRLKKGLTQKECANYLCIPLRTYQYYEENKKIDSFKYKYILDQVDKYGYVDEEHGLLSLKQIKESCQSIFTKEKYDVKECYLFGSYAKGYATENSDVGLFIKSSVSGLSYFGLIEEIRETLHKKIELINQDQIEDNPELAKEILLDGVKIYG